MDLMIRRVAANPEIRDSAPHYNEWFAANLNAIRDHRHMSYETMCADFGMNRKSLWRIMTGKHSATLLTATAIASSLGLDLPDLLLAPAVFARRFCR